MRNLKSSANSSIAGASHCERLTHRLSWWLGLGNSRDLSAGHLLIKIIDLSGPSTPAANLKAALDPADLDVIPLKADASQFCEIKKILRDLSLV
jgi:hypothetical protein